MQRIGDIELDQNLRFEQRQWRIQRVGWTAMLLVIVAAMLGLFGTGPLSSATAGSEDAGLSVQYQRFIRHQGEAELTITIAAGQASAGQVEVWIGNTFLEAIEIQSIGLEPEEVRAAGDHRIYVFSVEDSGQPLQLSISYVPKQMGRIPLTLGVNDDVGMSVTQFSYP